VEFILTGSKGGIVGDWPYAAGGQGWFNATGSLFPSATGTYILQANATSFFYAGLKTAQVVVSTSSLALFVYIAIAAVSLTLIALLLFRKRRASLLKESKLRLRQETMDPNKAYANNLSLR
jgi:hypothetical protein